LKTEGAAAHTIRVKITAGDAVLFDYDIRIDRITSYMVDPATGKKLPLIALDSLGKNAGLYMLFRLYIGDMYNGMTFRISYSVGGRPTQALHRKERIPRIQSAECRLRDHRDAEQNA
jgi:hypothetical protein